MLVKLAMLQSKCSNVSKLLGTELGTCLRRYLRSLQLYGEQALEFKFSETSGKVATPNENDFDVIFRS